MTRTSTHAVVCTITVMALLALHSAVLNRLADRDAMARILVARDYETMFMVLIALGTRVFLYLMAPGWVVFAVGRYAVFRFAERRLRRRRRVPAAE